MKQEMKDRSFKVKLSERIKIALFLLLISHFLFPVYSHAEVLDRVVAIVDDDVILASELEEAFVKAGKEIKRDKVLDNMINRSLLLKQAKKFRIGYSGSGGKAKEDDVIISEYIERRIRAIIHLPFEKMELYYKDNRESFGDKSFYDARDEIKDYLIKDELEKRLKEHITEMRKRSYIRIQLEE